MSTTVLAINEIVSDPAIRDGQPCLAGTGLRVSDVVAYYLYAGLTPEDLAVAFELTMGQVHAALAYYFLNKDEVDAAIAQESRRAEELARELEAKGRLIRLA